MPRYTWKAKDTAGRPQLREITADSASQARQRLLDEGLVDLVLVEDEIMHAACSTMDGHEFLGEPLQVTAEDRLKNRSAPTPTFLRAIGDSLWEDKRYYLVVAIILAFLAYDRRWIWFSVVSVLGMGWPLFRIWVALPGIQYARLNDAKDWYRWDEVSDVLDSIWSVRRYHFIQIPASELGRSRAQVLIAKGNLEAGLAEFARWKDAPDLPGWLYTVHLAGLYDLAKQHDRAIELNRESLRENPVQTSYLDLLHRRLRYKDDVAGAREVLSLIERDSLVDIAESFYRRCLGILALLEEDFATAKTELEASLKHLEDNPSLPFRNGHMGITKAYLCCACAGIGDLSAARRYLDEARKILVATRQTDLVERCERALANARISPRK